MTFAHSQDLKFTGRTAPVSEIDPVDDLIRPDGPPWPEPLATEALVGWPGRAVRAIAPHSEAGEAALLAHLLAGAGCLLGPNVLAMAGDARHPGRIFVGIVGATSKGRKGSAMRPVERILVAADADLGSRMAEGLSSGEGLIWQVRDPIDKKERDGTVTVVDPGVIDKRLLVVESELAGPLKSMARDGNTLSPVIRRAWDSGDLRTLTKHSPAVATDTHVVIIGHVTRDELRRYLDRTELASGLANRILWIAARRSKSLPEGEGVPDQLLADLAAELRAVRVWSATPRLLRRDDAAKLLWAEVYDELSEGRPGLVGAATSRAEAQVLRLSVLYAALDRSAAIRAEHLTAALAVWTYAEQSARWIFGDATGDPIADEILEALRQSTQLSRNDLRDVFSRHINSGRLARALTDLLIAGKVERFKDSDTGGRPREVWRAR